MTHNVGNARDFERLLHKNGFRITEQRRLVLEVLSVHGWHLTAEEIYVEARRQNRFINLATIYRTLTTLKESGLVEQYYVSPDHSESHFRLVELPAVTEPSSGQAVHDSFHFHCLTCGHITTFASGELDTLVLEALELQRQGFHLKQICMCVEGYCPDCARTAK